MLLQGTSPFWLTEKLSREELDGMGFQLNSSFPLPSAFCEPTEFWVLFMVLNYKYNCRQIIYSGDSPNDSVTLVNKVFSMP